MAEKAHDKEDPQAPTFGDPEEDDLDDLDEMLDEFSAAKIDSTEKSLPSSSQGKQQEAQPATESGADDDDDFANQLQAGMADLLDGIDDNPELQKQFEDLIKGFGNAANSNPQSDQAQSSKNDNNNNNQNPSAETEESFQETIRKTMERMQDSGDKASAAAASDNSDDILAQMLKEMQNGGMEGAGGGEDDFSKVLLGMMEQLTNKDILYEPMKELHDKFPAWLEKNGKTVSPSDLERYQRQQGFVAEIVQKFEEPSYTDSDPKAREFIVERMHQMQGAGSPPADLVGDMNSAQEAIADFDSGCPTQ
ncbi:Pex19-domain-containing protein [Xylona heveae TC161]|uniref:Pex19-domain-containing protein n=1 Tax=Xylona heveae (strain CBS 132557 / TC161) TaxID=1328760 RepID=A0A165J3M7_XYLHT|nr:Pex19-domain-containing protein [Xylona heveae TC161]KZF25685.1 Pex19-domain-containing protein [Xylona heveae TC161]